MQLDKRQNIVKKLIFRLVRKHIAGSTTSAMLDVVRRYNDRGIKTTITLLNDHVDNMTKAKYNTNAYMHLINQLSRLHFNADVSIRPSQLGYNLSKQQARNNLESLLILAQRQSICIWIENEKSNGTWTSLEEYSRLKSDYKGNIGVELPASQRLDYSALSEYLGKSDRVKLTSYPYTYPYTEPEPRTPLLDEKLRYIDMLTRLKTNLTIAAHEHKSVMKLYKALRSKTHTACFELPLCYSLSKLNVLIKNKVKPVMYTPYGTDWVPYAINGLAESRLRGVAIALLNGRKA